MKYPILCPICDEPSDWYGRPILTSHMIVHKRKCIMGHIFYSKEEVPKNYGAFQEYIEAIIEKDEERKEEKREKRKKYYWQKQNKERKRERKEASKEKKREEREERKRIKEDRKLHPENYPIDRSPGKHYQVIKYAGEKGSHIIESKKRRENISKGVKRANREKEKERRKRRDEYLKGGIRKVFSDGE